MIRKKKNGRKMDETIKKRKRKRKKSDERIASFYLISPCDLLQGTCKFLEP